jgi:RNA binding exosome subunit
MFHWIRLRAFVYATEEREKVLEAMRNVMDGDVRISHAEGAYGDPIEIIEMSGKRDRDVKKIISSMDESDRKSLFDTVDDRTDDDSVFHFRLDKQEAHLGNLRLASGGDVIGVELKLQSYPASREKAIESMRKFLEALL